MRVAVAAGPGLIGGPHRGRDDRKDAGARRQQTVHRRQSSRGSCAHRAADPCGRLPVPPASRLGRPHRAGGRTRRGRLCAARLDPRRRHRRGLRQGREAGGPALSRRPLRREGRRARRSGTFRSSPPAARSAGMRFLALGIEDRAAARLRAHRAAHGNGHRPIFAPPFRPRSSMSWTTGRAARCALSRRLPASRPRSWSLAGSRRIGPLRLALSRVAAETGVKFVAPPLDLCGDNAAMIAWAGIERLRRGMTDDLTAPVRARWPLGEEIERPGRCALDERGQARMP